MSFVLTVTLWSSKWTDCLRNAGIFQGQLTQLSTRNNISRSQACVFVCPFFSRSSRIKMTFILVKQKTYLDSLLHHATSALQWFVVTLEHFSFDSVPPYTIRRNKTLSLESVVGWDFDRRISFYRPPWRGTWTVISIKWRPATIAADGAARAEENWSEETGKGCDIGGNLGLVSIVSYLVVQPRATTLFLSPVYGRRRGLIADASRTMPNESGE